MKRQPLSSPMLVATLLALGLTVAPVALTPAIACPTSSSLAPAGSSIPLFDNLGTYQRPISTPSAQAQQYFNQGMILAYGFNHAEAARSFQAGIRSDENCAMCYWGLAYVLGPNINAPMALTAVPTAWEAIQQAQAHQANATPLERALIDAQAARYTPDGTGGDRAALDRAYATAMAAVYQQYPDDPDVATLYAEALMNTMPWDYWDENGHAKPETTVLLTTLEAAIAQHPDHIGALHLYIHAVEKEQPERAEAAADALLNLAPGAGHLVHMPSHIYIRIGRYHDAVTANQRAVAADDARPHEPSLYTLGYMPHNHHFEWFGAMMTGQLAIALDAAHHTAQVDAAMLQDPDFGGSLQHYTTMPLFTLVRFAQWDAVLATPAPAADLKYPTGIWHYAQGMALAAQGHPAPAKAHLDAMQALVADAELQAMTIWGFNTPSQVLDIAAAVLAGEIALADHNFDGAIAALQQATALESQLVYTEPPDWYASTQNLLGQGLLRAGRYADAEAAFRADLATYPENGWSLFGLAQSLRAQGKTAEAEAVQVRFEQAWQYADEAVTAGLSATMPAP
ncbi:MAG TPA: tetratricopeptide repeat protein [Candidatus Obscuribacterales bacterium]